VVTLAQSVSAQHLAIEVSDNMRQATTSSNTHRAGVRMPRVYQAVCHTSRFSNI
jgi:hypothetical protein